ncbi:MAG: DUF4149 domain-containing protein [Acidobacteria bacterium]|nr:DUF4149 domain-containing protein [Acidobacteriota bacterium]
MDLTLIDGITRLLLAVWLGSMICFSFLMAPSAFKVLPTRHMAGSIVNAVLGKVEWLGVGTGLILTVLLATTVVLTQNHQKMLGWIVIALPAVMAINCAISKWVVSAKMASLRQMMGEIDRIAVTDPLKIMFNNYHQYSVWLMGFNLLACIALILLQMYLVSKKAG